MSVSALDLIIALAAIFFGSLLQGSIGYGLGAAWRFSVGAAPKVFF